MNHSTQIFPPPSEPKTWRCGTLIYTGGGLVALFSFLLFGDFAWAMRDRSVGPMVQWYLSTLGVPNLVFAILMSSFPSVLAMILGPVISFKSDRLRSRWGRRIPFLLITTPMAAAGIIGLAVTPYVSKWVHGHFPNESEVLVAVICFAVFWTAFELATIAGGAVFGGLVIDVVPKELLGRFYGLFRAISLIDGMIFNYWIIGKVPAHFTLIMVAVGVFYAAAFTWVCFKVKEGEYPPPPGLPDSERMVKAGFLGQFAAGSRTYFRECFSRRYYVVLFVTLMVANLCFAPVNTFAIPYANSLGVDMSLYGKALALTYFISLSLSYFLGWLADVFHPIRMAMAVLVGYAAVSAWGALFATTANTFLIAWTLHGVLSGCFFTSAASLGARLYPHSRYAQFSSAGGIVGSLISMVFIPGVGWMIDFTGKLYHYTFAIGCGSALVALGCSLLVYRSFKQYGGPKHYVAPE